MKARWYFSVIVLLLLAAGMLLPAWCQNEPQREAPPAVNGGQQPQPHEALPAVHGDVQSDLMMYALLETPPPPTAAGARMIDGLSPLNRRLGGRPMLLWYHWANQHKRFLPSLAFLLFTAVLISSSAPHSITHAQGECKRHFWRCLLQGIFIVVLANTCVRAGVLTMIGWPLAIVLAGILELGLVAGLTVLILLLGQAIGHYLRMDKWITRADARRLACILLGALLIALLLQIPGFATLPRIGTRLVALLAIVGLGGLFRARRRQSETVQ